MAKKKTTKKPQNKKNVGRPLTKGKIYCRKCMKHYAESAFYDWYSYLDSNGKMSVCKRCCNDICNTMIDRYNEIERGIFETCKILNVKYDEFALKATMSNIENMKRRGQTITSYFGVYRGKLTLTGSSGGEGSIGEARENMTFMDSKTISQYDTIPKYDDFVNKDDENFNYAEYIKEWGEGFSKAELIELQENFETYGQNYDIDNNLVAKKLIKYACITELMMKRKLAEGNRITKDDLNNFSSILASANIRPDKETGNNSSEQVNLSNLIKKWEDTKPIPGTSKKKLHEFDFLHRVYLLGHLTKFFDKPNPYQGEYDKEMEQFTVMLEDDSIPDDAIIDINNLDAWDEGEG